MKIGILTFHDAHNYGAMLQCYALQQFLFKKGYNVEVIDYRPAFYQKQYHRHSLCPWIGKNPVRTMKSIYYNYYLFNKRCAAFSDFHNRHLYMSIPATRTNIPQSYDAYIGLIVGTGTNMATFIPSDKITKLDPECHVQGLIPVNLESGNFYPPFLTAVDDTVDVTSDSLGKQRFEKAVSGMYLGDILKAAFPLEEFEEKFDARKLTAIMNYPDIHKDIYVQVAHWIYNRSAQLVAASLAGLIALLKSYNRDIHRVCLIAEGSLFWSESRKDKNYNILVMEKLQELLRELELEDVEVHINSMDNANLIGTGIAALS